MIHEWNYNNKKLLREHSCEGFCDVDYVAGLSMRSLVTGYIFHVGDNMIYQFLLILGHGISFLLSLYIVF